MAAAQEASTAAPHSNANHEREPRTIHEDSSEVETIAEPSRETTPEVDQHHDDEKDVKDIGKVPAAAGASAEAKTDANKKDETYSIYGKANKAWLVSIITVLGFLSPLTANIYLPALPQVASDLGETTEAINLSVTIYMIFQGISPMFLGSMTDRSGRRPVYILCMILYAAANAGLANTNSYATLMGLRCLQAAGSASVISIGAGSIADLYPGATRALPMGIFQLGAGAGPSLGPVLGGVLAQAFGWRSLFYFLLILGGVGLAACVLFLPETARYLVGNGSKPAPTLIHETLWDLMRHKTAAQISGKVRPGLPKDPEDANRTSNQRVLHALAQPLQPLRFLFYPDVLTTLLANALPYTALYCVSATVSELFQSIYDLTTLQAGLVFLALGVPTMLSGVITGRLLNHDYARVKAQVDARKVDRPSLNEHPAAALPKMGNDLPNEEGLTSLRDAAPPNVPSMTDEKTDAPAARNGTTFQTAPDRVALFPIERARLRGLPVYLVVLCAALIGYGWSLQARTHIAVPIIMQCFIGYASGATFTLYQVLVVDLLEGKGAGVTASNNFVRCICGAIGVSVIDYILTIGVGWCYTIVAGVAALAAPLSLLLLVRGPSWREARAERLAAQEKAKLR